MLHRKLIVPAAAIVALLLAASITSAAGPAEIVVISTTLEPGQLEIDTGTTVTWRNRDSDRHRVRSEDGPVRFDSNNLDAGDSFSFTFTVEGSYPYYDHRDRDDSAYVGMIVVGGSGAADGPLPGAGAISIIDKSFRPGSFSIATGGSIEWSNDDGEAHTVTSTDSAFDSGIMNGGATFSQAFATPGSYPYFCLIHPEMRGTITVSNPVDEGSAVEPLAAEDTAVEPPAEAGEAAAPSPGDALDSLTPTATTVSVIDRSFQPGAVEVVAGDTVTWSNDDSGGHTVTAVEGGFDSGIMTVGEAFSTTFETAGTFDYFCAIHPEMTGTVTVLEPEAAPAGGEVASADTDLGATGIVVDVRSTITQVEQFELLLSDGQRLTLVPPVGVLERAGFSPSHLREHMTLGKAISVTYRPEAGVNVMTGVGDAE